MPDETNFTEQQQHEQDEGFWRRFWKRTRSDLLMTILVTIIAVQWVSMWAIEDHSERVARLEVRGMTLAQNAEIESMIGEIFKLARENRELKEENKRLKKEAEQHK